MFTATPADTPTSSNCQLPLIPVEVIRRTVVGDEDVLLPVAIEVGDKRLQTVERRCGFGDAA